MKKEYNFDWEKAFDLAMSQNDQKLLNEHLNQAQKDVLMPMLVAKTRNVADAEEISSIVISKFWERFFRNGETLPENPNGYLYRMGINAFFHHARVKEKKMKDYSNMDVGEMHNVFTESDHLEVEGHNEKKSQERVFLMLEKSMKLLDQRCQDLLRMFVYEGKKIKNIYKVLGIASPNAATKKKESCLNKLRKKMYVEVNQLKAQGYV